MNKYKDLKKIGEGTYGIVYKATRTDTGEVCALKAIHMKDRDEGIPCSAIREISILEQLGGGHTNIVKFVEVLHAPKELTLVFEFCDTDLKKTMDAAPGKQLPLADVKYYLYQLLAATAHCHLHRVLHRDLKPQNLLLNANGDLKLADFGLARDTGVPMPAFSSEVVTLWYRPPDVLLGEKNYKQSIDLWSVGCIFAEMLNGRSPFRGTSHQDQLKCIFKKLGTPKASDWPWKSLDPELIKPYESYKGTPLADLYPMLDKAGVDLLNAFLQYDPERRITAIDAMKHPFFDDLSEKKKARSHAVKRK